MGSTGVVFYGTGNNSQRGLYEQSGAVLTARADTQTPVPQGVGVFQEFSGPSRFRGDAFAFNGFGSSGQEGVYVSTPGAVARVADRNTQIPNTNATFSGFEGVSMDANGDVAFKVRNDNGMGQPSGIYLSTANTFTRLVAEGDVITGSNATVGFINAFSYDSGRLLFEAFEEGETAPTLFLRETDGTFLRILGRGDSINGHLYERLGIGPESLSGDQAALYFNGRSSGLDPHYEAIVTFTVPAPGMLPMLAAAGLHLRRSRRRRPN